MRPNKWAVKTLFFAPFALFLSRECARINGRLRQFAARARRANSTRECARINGRLRLRLVIGNGECSSRMRPNKWAVKTDLPVLQHQNLSRECARINGRLRPMTRRMDLHGLSRECARINGRLRLALNVRHHQAAARECARINGRLRLFQSRRKFFILNLANAPE